MYRLEDDDDPLTLFYDGIKDETTKKYYERRWEIFLDWIPAEGNDLKQRTKWFIGKAKLDPNWAELVLIKYARHRIQKAKEKNLSGGTVRNYFKPIWLCLEQNGILMNQKRIRRMLPKERSHANDRAPNVVEIKKMLDYPDRRVKPAVLVMISSGIRLGVWNHMKWGHIQPIKDREGNIVAAKLHACDTKNDDEWYDTFITPEAYLAIKEYMDYRASCGELIGENSPVLRNRFDANSHGLVGKPKRLCSDAMKNLMGRVLKLQGIRSSLPEGKRRHEFQVNHGFRKFFETNCKQAGITESDVEWLMNHHDSYHRPSEQWLLESYLQAVPKLTISEQVKTIEKLAKVDELEQLTKKLGEDMSLMKQQFDEERKIEGRKLEEVLQTKGKLEKAVEELNDDMEFVKLQHTSMARTINAYVSEGIGVGVLSKEDPHTCREFTEKVYHMSKIRFLRSKGRDDTEIARRLGVSVQQVRDLASMASEMPLVEGMAVKLKKFLKEYKDVEVRVHSIDTSI